MKEPIKEVEPAVDESAVDIKEEFEIRVALELLEYRRRHLWNFGWD